jgi:uncharacterized protein
MPRSSSARFTEMWQKSVGDEGFLDSIVDRPRHASASAADAAQSASMFAESVNLPANVSEPPAQAVCEDRRTRSRANHAERPDFAALRRKPGVAAAPPAKSGSAVRHAREIAPALKGRRRRARAFCPRAI